MTVTRRRRAAVAVAWGLFAVAAIGGCASDEPTSPEARATPPAPSVTGPGARPEMPSTSSGELDRQSLPKPASLGQRWHYRVNPGDPEDGSGGNGTAATARDPREVTGMLSPLGCRPVQLPVPDSALEVTYAHAAGTPAVGLLLEFASADRATEFFRMRAQAMRDCAAWGPATADVVVLRDTPAVFVSVRDEQVGATPVWSEGVRRTGDRVLFVAVRGDGEPSRRAVARALG